MKYTKSAMLKRWARGQRKECMSAEGGYKDIYVEHQVQYVCAYFDLQSCQMAVVVHIYQYNAVFTPFRCLKGCIIHGG